MSLVPAAIKERIRVAFPDALFRREDVVAYSTDAWPRSIKAATGIMPVAVVAPRSADEAARLLRLANELGCNVVPFGGGTNVVGGIALTDRSIVLDVGAMGHIGRLNEQNATISVEAGVRGGRLESTLRDAGFTLGHYPQSLHESTVGGWVATGAIGSFSTKYGGIATMVAGLHVVLADGSQLDLGGSPRSAMGPSLTQLFVGSEGAFGVVTSATLRIRRIPEARHFSAFASDTMDQPLEALRNLLQAGVIPAAVRIYDEAETAALASHLRISGTRCLTLLVFDGTAVIAAAEQQHVTQVLTAAGLTNIGPEPAERWHANQFGAAWLKDGNRGIGRVADAIEVAVGWDDLTEMIRRCRLAAQADGAEVWAHVSHLYPDGASVYFIFFVQRGSDAEAVAAYDAVWDRTLATALELGATLSHHHGVGQVRRRWLRPELGAGGQLLDAVRCALDPDGVLSPRALGGRG